MERARASACNVRAIMYNRITNRATCYTGSQLHTVAENGCKRAILCRTHGAILWIIYLKLMALHGGICVALFHFSLYHFATSFFVLPFTSPSIQISFASIRLCSLFHFHVRLQLAATAAAAAVAAAFAVVFLFIFLLLLIRSCSVSIVSASFVQFI